MGIQRFVGYLKPLEHHLSVETETRVKVATLEAIGQIRADPVETRPASAPVAGSASAPEPGGAAEGAPVGD